MNTSDINDKMKNEATKGDKSLVNGLIIGTLGALSGLYLCFPGSVAVRAVVDFIPVAGMFDEAAAAAIMFSCLSYFGLDLTSFFGKAKEYDKRSEKKEAAKTVNAKVVAES